MHNRLPQRSSGSSLVTVLRMLILISHDSVSLKPINPVFQIPLHFQYNSIRVLADTSSRPNAPRDGLGLFLFLFWLPMEIERSGYDIGSRWTSVLSIEAISHLVVRSVYLSAESRTVNEFYDRAMCRVSLSAFHVRWFTWFAWFTGSHGVNSSFRKGHYHHCVAQGNSAPARKAHI